MFQEASAIILSNFSTSVALGEAKCFWKYCRSIVPDWRASATPEYVLCCPESPNKAMVVTLKRRKIINTVYISECINVFFIRVCQTLPVGVHSFSDHRLCVTSGQVPHVEVGCGVQHAEDRGPGLGPLQRDHCGRVVPLCHWLLWADCM